MAKRPGGISLMAQGPSFQRTVRLANALRMRDRKKLVDPTDEDIQDMRAKIGDNLSFARLADANKSDLFCAMLTIRHKLQIYDDLVKSEEEELGPLLSALASLVAAIPNCHGLLTRAVVEMSETCGTTVGDAWRMIDGLANSAQSLLEIIQVIPDEPTVYDKRLVRSLRQRDQAEMIRDCLKIVGIKIIKTGPDEYGNEGDDGLEPWPGSFTTQAETSPPSAHSGCGSRALSGSSPEQFRALSTHVLFLCAPIGGEALCWPSKRHE
jgi:hypothetical protein